MMKLYLKNLKIIRDHSRHSRTIKFAMIRVIRGLLLFFLACSKTPTPPSTFSLSGTVHQEGQEDHSGVTVALYNLVELDTAVVRLQKEFPFVGIPISQQTEFDHRLTEPIYQTRTARDGSYRIDNIKGGSYNLVALKDGFGWKYLFDIEIAKEKTTAPEIQLYAEKEISGNLNSYQVWEENHHYIIKSDATVPEGAMLVINQGACVRFAENTSLIVHGTLEVNGDSQNMVRMTSDQQNPEIGHWRMIDVDGLESKAHLNWATIEYAQTAIKSVKGALDVANCSIRKAQDEEIYAANNAKFDIKGNSFSHFDTGIKVEGNSSGSIELNFIYNDNYSNSNYAIVTNNSNTALADNIIHNTENGIRVEFGGDVETNFNQVMSRKYAISIREANPLIEKNTLICQKDTRISLREANPTIVQNNILCKFTEVIIEAFGLAESNINATKNFWDTNNRDEIFKKILDKRTDNVGNYGSYIINIDPISSEYYAEAKPRGADSDSFVVQ
jgi:hypothetical protein